VRFFGKVGYISQIESAPGVWTEQITERPYYGDVTRNYRRLEGSDQINQNLITSNEISILADAYAYDNFFNIKYIWWMGTRWIVSTVEVNRPRLKLTLGSIYNGNTTSTT